MPMVPRYDTPTVEQNGQPLVAFGAPQARNFALDDARAAQAGVQQLSAATQQIVLDKQNEANHLRVIDASNQAKERMFDLMYHPEEGGMNQRGINALERTSGEALPDEYTKRFKVVTDDLTKSLGNEQQRKMFAQHAAQMHLQMNSSLQQHLGQEFRSYRSSVMDGTVSAAQREIGLMGVSGSVAIDPSNPQRNMMQSAMERIEVATRQKAKLMGVSQTLADESVRAQQSTGLTIAIEGALKNGNVMFASQMVAQYKDAMTPQDVLRVSGMVTKEVNAKIATVNVAASTQKYQAGFQPNDMDRFIGVVMGMESGGKDYAPDGSVLTSPKGAQGRMQVLTSTNKDPGYGVAPAKDDSLEERARVGRDYAVAMVKQYGNAPMALAAYNAGPGAVDEAIKKAQRSVALNANDPNVQPHTWLDFLPAETKRYVANGMKKLEAGQGVPNLPSELEFVSDVVARLGPNPTAEQVQITQQTAEHRYGLLVKAKKDADDRAISTAMQGVIENKGQYSDLPVTVRAGLPPEAVEKVMGFAQKISKGDDTSSLWLYGRLANNPMADPYTGAPMSGDAFFKYRSELSEGDFKHFSQERAKLTGNSPSGRPGDLNSVAIKQTLDARLRMLHIDPSPKDDGGSDAARIGGIRQFVDQYFAAAQLEAGKKFSDAEVAAHIDVLFAKNGTFQKFILGVPIPNSEGSAAMLSLRYTDLPLDERYKIRQAFVRKGISGPTEAQIMNAYWKLKLVRK